MEIKKKVLLVVLRCKNNVPLIPIGTLYIACALRTNDIDYKIIDLNFYIEPQIAIQEVISEYVPDYIGISIRNIAETKRIEEVYDDIKSLVINVKKYGKVILGGAGFSLFPKEIMEYTGADYGIVGPGEEEIVKYIKLQENEKDAASIKRADIVERFTTSNIAIELVKYWEKYGKYHRILNSEIPIQRVRGCSNICTYCSYPGLNSMKLQYRDERTVIEEVAYIYEKINYNNFYFVDAIFNMNLDYSKIFLKRWYEKFRDHLKWKCCINPANCDKELFELMKLCGCVECEIGIDSCNDIVLSKMKKKYAKRDIIRVLNEIEQVGIIYTISVILGGEGETQESIRETIDCLESYSPRSIMAFCGVRIYPTTMYCTKLKCDEKQLFYANEESFYISQTALEGIKGIIQNPPERWNLINVELFHDL